MRLFFIRFKVSQDKQIGFFLLATHEIYYSSFCGIDTIGDIFYMNQNII
jgi:hypothetical protein